MAVHRAGPRGREPSERGDGAIPTAPVAAQGLTLGQLWYGWAPRGVEGVNRRQLIAGSGDLAIPTHGLTQQVVKWCYETAQPAMGWVESRGVGVAFRRTPTGQDASGREGAYFCHALVWRAGTLPAELLAGLWDAQVWVTEPPAKPPPQLPALTSVGALQLTHAGPRLDRRVARCALASYLENLAGGRRSVLDLPPQAAYAYAGEIARQLPRAFGLPAFSTFETERRAPNYDLVAAPAPATGFAPIVLDDRIDALWLGAADLLGEAAAGDRSAADVIAALTASAGTPAALAAALRQWAAYDTGAAHDPRGLGSAAREPRLLARLVERNGWAPIAQALVEGHSAARIVDAARSLGRGPELLTAVRTELARRPPAASLAGLANAQPALGAGTATTAARLGQDWLEDGSLAGLRPEESLKLLRLAGREATLDLVDALVVSPELARAVRTEPGLSAEVGGRAAALHPGLFEPRELARRLRKDWEFATAYARGADPAQLRELAAVLEVLDATDAYQVLDAIDRHLPEHARTELARAIIARLEPHQRLEPIRRYAPRGAQRDPVWNTLSLDALVAHTLRVRDRDSVLWAPAAILLTPASDARVRAWDDLSAALQGGIFESHVEAALHAVDAMTSEPDRDAALELIVDAGATQLVGQRDAWQKAMRELEAAGPDPPGDFAARLARAALRRGEPDRRLIALRTVHWVARALDRRELGRGEVGDPPFSRLHERLHPIDVEVVDEAARAASRGPGQKWLKDTVKALNRRHA